MRRSLHRSGIRIARAQRVRLFRYLETAPAALVAFLSGSASLRIDTGTLLCADVHHGEHSLLSWDRLPFAVAPRALPLWHLSISIHISLTYFVYRILETLGSESNRLAIGPFPPRILPFRIGMHRTTITMFLDNRQLRTGHSI